jgi:hypothetical protein
MPALTPEQITALLKPKAKAKPAKGGHTAREMPPQWGPLKFFDKERQCENSGYVAIDPETNERYYKKTHGRCGAPTNWELNGVPYCLLHASYKMSDTLFELNGGKIEVRYMDDMGNNEAEPT